MTTATEQSAPAVERGTYEIIRDRLVAHARALGEKAEALNARRLELFGSTELKVVGNLICSGDVQIDGAVEGDVESRTVTIGEGAKVKGGTSGETVIISGEINGAVRGTTVRIARSARVTGDVTYKSLSIEEGAVLNGNCIHDSKVETSSAATHKRGDSGHVANVYTTAKATG